MEAVGSTSSVGVLRPGDAQGHRVPDVAELDT